MRKKSLVLMTTVTMMASMIAVGSPAVLAEDSDPLEITWVNPTVGIEYWTNADNGAKAAAEEFGVDLNIVGPTETSPEQQASYIDTAASQGVDGIMTCPWDVAFTPSLKAASDAGIPVVAVDTDDPDCGRIAFYGTSNYDAGYKAGELMAEVTDGKAKICILTAVLTSPTQADRIKGFTDAISEYPDMEILTQEQTDSDLQKSVDKATACVGAYPECDAFFGAASLDGAGAAKAVEEMGMSDKYTIICFDDVEETIKYVKSGVIYGTIVQDPYMMAYSAVKAIVDYHNGIMPEQEINAIDVNLITADNVNEKYPD
ncbi:MAG: substrate-binding domain-containing protein [Eubacteriales bacterium]|nr:substrate-binding domain-containing protein [Eubacteriales bacterium]